MNPDIEAIFMKLGFEAYNKENHFTKEQREKLCIILDEAKDLELNLKNPFSFVRNFKKVKKCFDDYEKAFIEFGGDAEKLENKLKEIREQKLKALGQIFKIN